MGAENYGFVTKNGAETCKVKGFSLNSEGSSGRKQDSRRDPNLLRVQRMLLAWVSFLLSQPRRKTSTIR